MKWEFQLALAEAMRLDPSIILIFGDVGYTMFRDLRQQFPDRCINGGLCEQSMVSMAAGMAIEGFRPVLYSITPFLLERAFEQIKLDIDQMNLPVGLVGYSDHSAGPTHVERSFEGMKPLLPRTLFIRVDNKGSVRDAVLACIRGQLWPWFLLLQPAHDSL